MQSERTFSRREFGLRLGFGLAGLNLLNTFSSGLAAAPPMQQREKVRNTILIVLTGGMSQLDSFDYKPHAPSDIRGPFQPVQTKTREAVFSSLFPSLAAIDDQFLLFRAMKAKEAGAHEAAYGNWLRFNNRNDHLITTRLTRSNTDTIPYVNLMQEGTNLMEPEHVAHMNPGQAILIRSKTHNHSLSAFLKVGHPLSLQDGKLVIGFEFDFHAERVREAKNKKIVQEVVSEVLGQEVSVSPEVDTEYRTHHQKFNGAQEKEVEEVLDVMGGGEVV
jgi:hypothetical protein